LTATTPKISSSGPADQRSPRIQLHTLAGMRGILMFTVFFGHVALAFVLPVDASIAVLRVDAGIAEAALGLFFMLSGFLLTWVARPGEPYRRFIRRRLVKVFPNHVVTWTAGLILMFAFGVFTHWWAVLPGLFLVQSWIPVPEVLEGANGPSWSLSCELFMYAVFPFLLAWGLKLDTRRLWRALLVVAGAIIGFTVLVGLLVPAEPRISTTGDLSISAAQFYILIFHPLVRLLDFALGILIARLVISGQWRPVRARWMWLLLVAGWLLSLVLPPPLGFMAPFVPGLILVLGRAATADINGVQSIFTKPWAIWLGNRSFAFYLVHGNVLIYGERLFGEGPYPWVKAVPFVTGVLVVSLLLAHLLHIRVENPMMARYARPRRKPVAAEAPRS
jgi:peptidoglycan/LPS O-acetylase OafA/YrhL